MTRILRSLWYAVAYLVVSLAAGCDLFTAPTEPFPELTTAIAPVPAEYREWWAQVAKCSGRTASFDAVRFYVTELVTWQDHTGDWVIGQYRPQSNAILVALWAKDSPEIVRHEMLHAFLAPDTSHPREYFHDRCGSLVVDTSEQ